MKPQALIRTYVPSLVGTVIAVLATWGLQVDDTTRTALVAVLTGLATVAYYTAVHVLETRWPFFSVLLGSTVQPTYTDKPPALDPATATQGAPDNQG